MQFRSIASSLKTITIAGGALGLVVQQQELLRLQRELRIGLAEIVLELHLVGSVQNFHHRAHLPPHQAVPRQVAKQCNNIQQARFRLHDSSPPAGNNS